MPKNILPTCIFVSVLSSKLQVEVFVVQEVASHTSVKKSTILNPLNNKVPLLPPIRLYVVTEIFQAALAGCT